MSASSANPAIPDSSSWVCPTCGSIATGAYCGACGESASGRAARYDPRRGVIRRMWASVQALVAPPGRLTSDWLRGRRVGYLTPLSLFLWVNVVFFLVQSASGLGILTWPLRVHLSDDSIAWLTTRLFALRRGAASADGPAYTAIFDALEAVHAKSLVIVMVPAFALALAALVADRRVSIRQSMIFATHFFAFALLWLCVLFPLAAAVVRIAGLRHMAPPLHHTFDAIITAFEAGVLGAYLYVAIDTVFALPRLRRLVTAVALVAVLYVILKAYHVVVFAVTLYST